MGAILKLLFIITLFCLGSSYVIAQDKHTLELRGEVRDSLTRQPLAFAHVTIKEKAIGVSTNKEGKFSLQFDSHMANDTLLISLIGYTSQKIPVGELLEKSLYSFYLAENTISLEEVVIKAEDAEGIVKEVARRLKDNLPSKPYEFEGYYTNAYKESDTYVKQAEVAFHGFDGNFHYRSGHSVGVLKKRESPDFRQFKWRQTPGNISWHYLWHIRRQHHHFFVNRQYNKYDYSIEDILYFEGEKVYKLRFVLKDTSERITESWAYIRASNYAIIEIGGNTRIVNPKKFKLSDSLFMAYKGGSILVKYVAHQGKMYPSYSSSLYEHEVHNGRSVRQGNFDMNEEMIIHQISTPAKHVGKKAFQQSWQAKLLSLPADSIFWKRFNKPLQTAISRAIEKDLTAQIKAAGYNQDTISVDEYKDELIAVEKLKEDFTLFKSSLQEAHPSLYRYTPKQEMDSLFQTTYENLTKSLSESEFYQQLTPIIAQIRCGHTGSLPSRKYWDYYADKALFLPIQVTYIEGKLHIIKAFDLAAKAIEGYEIVSVNGSPIEEIIGHIIPHVTADGYITCAKHENMASDFAKLYSLYIAKADSFTIVTKNRNREFQTIRTPAISYNRYLRWKSNSKRDNEYSLLDAKTALLKVATFTDTDNQPFKDWINDSFEELKAKKISNLIIDLRNNEGGRDDYAMYLLSFLTKAPFHYHRSLKAAGNHFSFLANTNQNESLNSQMVQIVQKDSTGNFMLRNTHPTLQLTYPVKNAFAGKCYFLINSRTFSAAADFAALAKELKLGAFIGQETASASEGNTSNGEILLNLPHSGIRVGIPLFQITNAVLDSYPKGRGVIPEYVVSYTVEDFVSNTDSEMKLVIELISTDNKKRKREIDVKQKE